MPEALGALGGAASAITGSTGSTNTTNTQQSGSQSGSQNQSSTGSTQNQQQNVQQTQANLPDWYLNFMKSMIPQYQNQVYQAGKPLLGAQQQAQYNQQVNQGTQQAQQNLQSLLARSGALNSGRAAEMQTNLQLGGLGQKNAYAAQMPVINQQNSQQMLAQLLGQGMNFRPPVVGQTTTGQSTSITDVINQLMNSFNSQSQSTTDTKEKIGGTGLLGAI